ncbi:MAG: DUF423 domain-containing protein [Saprospiraceae bacterium]|nr:DUF423 domain-containing protein [Saprospiraceae bacterium]
MRKTFFRLASALALAGVILGAFASHGLKDKISPDQIDSFQVGVRYHFYHSIAILAIAILLYFRKTSFLVWAGWVFAAGILLFSGSIYLLSTREWTGIDWSWLGPVTPLGGLLFITGWALLFLSSYQDNTLRNGGNGHHNGNGNGHAKAETHTVQASIASFWSS